MKPDGHQTQLILDAIPSLVFLKDTSNRILRVNQAVLNTLGLSRNEVEGRESLEIYPDDAARFYEDDLEVIRSGRPKLGYTEKAGDRWVQTDKVPLANEQGEIHRLLIVATDVTEFKRAEAVQHEARRLLEIAGRIAGLGGWELDVPAGEIRWSEQVCRIHDVPAGYKPTVDEAIDYYTPESRELIRGLVQKAIDEGVPWDVELSIRTKLDRYVWVRAIGEAESIDGECVRLWGTLQDITALKQREQDLLGLNEELERRAKESEEARQAAEVAEAEKAAAIDRLTESERRFRTLFDESPVMHANVNAYDATIRDCNKMLVKRLGFLDKSELIGRPIHSIYSESCHDDVQRAFEEFVETGEVTNEPLRLLGQDGEAIPVILNVSSVKDETGRIIYSSSTWSDVTELTRANRDLEEFAYVASHDLKAPLRAINHLAAWLEEDLQGKLNDSSEQHLTQLKQRVVRMERLLDDLLSYSRAGSSATQWSRVDLGELVAGVAGLYGSEVQFMICLDLAVREVEVCKTPLETTIRNLVSNAIKHHDRDEVRIEITSRLVGEKVEICVSDDGPGIPADLRERAFRMFQTLRPRDEVEGSGMGLALTKRLVETNGGTVAIEQAEPHGVRVRMAWPIRIDKVPAVEAAAPLTSPKD